MREYFCAKCHWSETVDEGVALWQVLHDMKEKEEEQAKQAQKRAPGFFSFAFHSSYFPAIFRRNLAALWSIWFPPKNASPFHGHVPIEYIILPMLCLAAAGGGLGSFFMEHSLGGGIIGGLGALGLGALLIHSVWERWSFGNPVSYDDFEPMTFLLFLLLGLHAGVLFALDPLKWPPLGAALGGVAGLLAGYALGIFVGLWIQVLGWIAISIRLFFAFALFVICLADLFMGIGFLLLRR